MLKIGKWLTNLILLVLGAAVVGIVLPNLFGIKTMAVLSGSMEPAYKIGSLVYVVPTAPETIKEEDVISFVLNSRGTVVTHRVVEVDEENERFYVKGDANQVRDANPVKFANVLGKVNFGIPMLGYVLHFLTTTSGRIVAGTVLIALILIIMLFEEDRKKEEQKPKQKKVYSREDRYIPKYKQDK